MSARLVLVGDSIAAGYAPYVMAALERAHIDVRYVPATTSRALLDDIDAWESIRGAEVVHANVGLADLAWDPVAGAVPDAHTKSPSPNPLPSSDRPAMYAANVGAILTRLREQVGAVIWATCTPVLDDRAKAEGREWRNADVRAYNSAAIDVARAMGVPRDDLYMAIVGSGAQEALGPDGVHLNEDGYLLCAEHVVRAVRRALPGRI